MRRREITPVRLFESFHIKAALPVADAHGKRCRRLAQVQMMYWRWWLSPCKTRRIDRQMACLATATLPIQDHCAFFLIPDGLDRLTLVSLPMGTDGKILMS